MQQITLLHRFKRKKKLNVYIHTFGFNSSTRHTDIKIQLHFIDETNKFPHLSILQIETHEKNIKSSIWKLTLRLLYGRSNNNLAAIGESEASWWIDDDDDGGGNDVNDTDCFIGLAEDAFGLSVIGDPIFSNFVFCFLPSDFCFSTFSLTCLFRNSNQLTSFLGLSTVIFIQNETIVTSDKIIELFFLLSPNLGGECVRRGGNNKLFQRWEYSPC